VGGQAEAHSFVPLFFAQLLKSQAKLHLSGVTAGQKYTLYLRSDKIHAAG
jgi:hypothetical protein